MFVNRIPRMDKPHSKILFPLRSFENSCPFHIIFSSIQCSFFILKSFSKLQIYGATNGLAFQEQRGTARLCKYLIPEGQVADYALSKYVTFAAYNLQHSTLTELAAKGSSPSVAFLLHVDLTPTLSNGLRLHQSSAV